MTMMFCSVYICMYNYTSQIPYRTDFSKKLVRIEHNKNRNELFIGISFRYGVAHFFGLISVKGHIISLKPHSHCAGVATVHPDAGQPVYRDAPGHIS